jgi:hypothetical protein
LRAFQPILNPAPPCRIGDVHEFGANRPAVDASRLLGEFAVDRQFRVRRGAEKAEGIEVGLEVSPTTVHVEHALAFSVGWVQYCGGSSGSSLRSNRHMSVTRIMDERRIGTDSSGKVAARRIAQASLTACGKILGVDHLRITLGLGLVALAIMLFLALSGIVGSEFLPHLDEGAIWVRGTLASSTGPSSSIALAKQTRLALATFPEVTQVVSQEGRPDDGSDASGFYNTEFFVDLLPHSE